jgi:hypothetical protein
MTPLYKRLAFAILIGTTLSQSCIASITIFDDFNDGSLNASIWNMDLPFVESSFTEAGGKLTLNNRAIISTVSQITTPIKVSGTVMGSRHDTIRIVTRTDLSVENAYFNEIAGLKFSFHYDSNTVHIHDSLGNTIGEQPYTFSTSQWYDFEITDDGTNVSWSIDGVSLLSGVSNYSGGNFVAVHNREVNRGWAIPSTSSFDSFSILGIPEPSRALLSMIGLILIGSRASRRKNQQ